MKRQYILLLLIFSSCAQKANTNSIKDTVEIPSKVKDVEDAVDTVEAVAQTDNSTNFKEVLQKLKQKSVPLIDSTSFDSFIDEEDYKTINTEALKLVKIYKNWNNPNYNYRAIDAYRLNLSNKFYTVVVSVLLGDNELENRLINYDLNGSIITSEIVAYDEIAEGWTRYQSKIEAKKITIKYHVLVSDDDASQMEINTLKIEANGTLKQLTIDDVFYALVIKTLNINSKKLIPSLQAFKILPNSPNQAVVVIPEVVEGSEEEHYFYLNTHIAIVNLETKQITHQYFESSKTNGWVSDAIVLTDIIIDTAPYSVTDNIRAFGIKTHFVGSSRANQYESENLSLFVKLEDKLQKVLDNYEVLNNGGEWDGFCFGKFIKEEKILIISPQKTNEYYDIIVKNKITETNNFEDEKGECDYKETITHQTSVLKFDGKTYN
ncbi:hypothetical protein [uncultured Sunxiuqinia sp.]|uniref:hypothetical protein n=1 Tax=uncultured Sunxiuqinia sp. TaxID=1573825 RepID=UPI002AA88802|nr:hypothetical protein [uncultured Sunxiuqinia sp.]